MEMLEIRTPLDGACLVNVIGGDLVIECDASDNGIKVTQEAPGSYRVITVGTGYNDGVEIVNQVDDYQVTGLLDYQAARLYTRAQIS